MKVLLIDAFNMIHRARFGHAQGEHGITYTFFRSLRSEVERHKPDRMYIITEGRPVKRIAENAEYKANRTQILDDGFHRQKRDILNLCSLLPISMAKHPEHECDDVIAHIAREMHSSDEHVVCSSDSDFIQLLDDSRIKLWNPVKKNFVEPVPNYVVWKALRGDKSDNIPGVKGVGDVTASKLTAEPHKLQEFLNSSQEKRNDFDSSYRQILFEEVDRNGVQFEDYLYDPLKLREEFVKREFSSLVDKQWVKWSATWQKLEDKCKHR